MNFWLPTILAITKKPRSHLSTCKAIPINCSIQKLPISALLYPPIRVKKAYLSRMKSLSTSVCSPTIVWRNKLPILSALSPTIATLPTDKPTRNSLIA